MREWNGMGKAAFLALVLVASGVQSCGGAKGSASRDGSGQAESLKGSKTDGAAKLGLRIVAAGNDPAFPDITGSSAGIRPAVLWDEAVAQGNEISFKNVILIPPGPTPRQFQEGRGYHPLFMVWSEDWQGVAIRQASYDHRIQDEKNVQNGEVDRSIASFDEKSRSWFIPLSRLFKRSDQDADPAEVHLITLDLLTADHERAQVKIALRMAAAVPSIQGKALPPEPVPARYAFNYAVYKLGWPLLTEEFANPTARKLALWVRWNPSGTAPLQLRNYLKNWECPGGVVKELHGLVSASITPGRVLVKRAQGAKESRISNRGQWVRIVLDPLETVSVTWMGDLSPGAPIYNRWDRRPWNGQCGGEIYIGLWVRESTVLKGEWSRSVVLSDEMVHHPEKLKPESSRVRTLADGTVKTLFQNGPEVSGPLEILRTDAVIEAIKSGPDFDM